MLRLFVLFTLLFINIYACQGGYESCILKIKDSRTLRNSSLYIPVKNSKLLVYSRKKPNAKILKYDPFLSLYLIEDNKKFKYPFRTNMQLQLGQAMVNNRLSREGKILRNQVGLNLLATFNTKLLTPSLVTSSCCNLEGIVTPRGIIQKAYIRRFLSSASADYGDIGIRVKNSKGFIVVTASNPYLEDNLMQQGDKIIAFDGVKMSAASVFMKKVLFSKIGSKHTLIIQRGAKKIKCSVLTRKRHGGGIISDTFLEPKGIYFDKNLHIIKLSQKFLDYGLIIGDRLLQVNGVAVQSQEELLVYIEHFKDFSALLFERRNFQFFVNIK